jgi:hypothetical protein
MEGKSRKGFVRAGNAAASQAWQTMDMWAHSALRFKFMDWQKAACD